MPAFTVEIESRSGTSSEEDLLEFVAQHLVEDERILGPATSLDRRSGTIGTTFQVSGRDDDASDMAVGSFLRALASAGIDHPAVQSVEAKLDS